MDATEGVVYSTAGIPPHELWLKVEAQFVHKLIDNPDYVLFSIHTYTDRLDALANDRHVSNAAGRDGIDIGGRACAVLAEVIRSLPELQLRYRDLLDCERRESLLRYLDSLSLDGMDGFK